MLACRAGEVIVAPNLHTGYNTYGSYGLVSQIGLPVCHQVLLSYFVVVSSASPHFRKAREGAADCFVLYSVVVLFLHAFQLSCPSFVVPNALLLFLSS
jgi:hypothetical protein